MHKFLVYPYNEPEIKVDIKIIIIKCSVAMNVDPAALRGYKPDVILRVSTSGTGTLPCKSAATVTLCLNCDCERMNVRKQGTSRATTALTIQA